MSAGRGGVVLTVLGMLTAGGCGGSEGDLEVWVTTDRLAGTDFARVRSALFDDLPTSGGTLHGDPVVFEARADGDWVGGARVARFEGVPHGRWAVQAELLTEDGAPVGVRAATATVRSGVTRVTLSFDRPAPMLDGGAPPRDAGTVSDAGVTEAGTPDDDAGGPEEDAGPAVDAGPGPPAACATAGPDSTTLALWTFDADDGAGTFADSARSHVGTMVGALVSTTAGPSGCGAALAFPATGDVYGRVADSRDWNLDTGAVDFWVRVDAVPTTLQGILSRDASGTATPGHLTVAVTQEGLLVARLQNSDGWAIRCTASAVQTRRWVHVGIQFGGAAGFAMFVDGERADRAGDISILGPDPAIWTCGGHTSRGIRGNDNPWVFGASAAYSAEASAEPVRGLFRNGAIDHVRISSTRRDF